MATWFTSRVVATCHFYCNAWVVCYKRITDFTFLPKRISL